ncbi:MAG: hypothetical protein RL391_49 [Actinomycetota bacterium]
MRLLIYSWRQGSAVEASEHLNQCAGFDDARAASSLAELRDLLSDGGFDALVVGHFAVSQFMVMQPALEREGILSLPRVVASRGAAPSVVDDSRRLGFDAVVDLGLTTTAEVFLPEITRICATGRQGRVPMQLTNLDLQVIRLRFSVLYADRIDYAIGAFVAAKVRLSEIAERMGLSEAAVRDRALAIIRRSRLLDLRELGAYHAGGQILDQSVQMPTDVVPMNL